MHRDVQDFIREHADWRDVLTRPPYLMRITEDPESGLVLFAYSSDSDFSHRIVRECRGLILDGNTLDVVSVGFDKFFNYGEPLASEIDWSTARTTQKMDGSLVTLYHFDGKWRLKSNATMDAAKVAAPSNPTKSLRDLFAEAERDTPVDYASLDPDVCYSFELLSPENRVVIPYPETSIIFLMGRNRVTGDEIDSNPTGVPPPNSFPLQSLDECVSLAKSLGSDVEGFVVCDAQHRRIKVKTDWYVRMHHMKDAPMTVARAIDIVKSGEFDECSVYMSNWERRLLGDVRRKMHEFKSFLARVKKWVDWLVHDKHGGNYVAARKSVPKLLQDMDAPQCVASFCYLAFDGRLDDVDAFWRDFRRSKFENVLRNNELMAWVEKGGFRECKV